jgi:hypothetical protein
MTPAQLALVDQAHAATRHAYGTFFTTAAIHGYPLEHRLPAGSDRAILQRLEAGLASGTTTLCPHLFATSPVPTFWVAWRPGRVRCAPCARAILLATKGTPEDQRCDRCRKVRSSLISVNVQLPALVWPTELRALGPIMVTFGLCGPCRESPAGHDGADSGETHRTVPTVR